jgi:hypothetical protein
VRLLKGEKMWYITLHDSSDCDIFTESEVGK